MEMLLGGALLAQSADCVKLVDLQGQVVHINEEGKALLGLDGEQTIVGSSWAGFWPLEMRPTIEDALARSLQGGVARFTGLCPTAHGVKKWWDVAVSPVRDEQGDIRHHLCVSRDVTEPQAIKHSLMSSEQRFRALADNMAQLAWMADANGDVVWFNQRWTDYTGTSLSEMSGKGWRKVHHPEYVEHVVEKMNKAFKNCEMWEDVVPLRRADGSYRWFLSRAVPMADEAGRVVLWCATHTDITDQRILGQRLRQLARVIELSHEAILVWDPEDGIILWNKGCEELYGYGRSVALGAAVNHILACRSDETHASLVQQLLRDGEWNGEVKHRCQDGAEVWVDSRQEVIRAGGRNLVLETNRDITERRKADALRDLLLAELNHRVKNTLAIVQSLAVQTARTQPDMASFVTSFTGRVQALAVAQTILSDAHWLGAPLKDLVASQLAITIGSGNQTVLTGDNVFLPAQTALQLTLILHELATNAKRFGALSSDRGRVDVTWNVDPETPSHVVLDWRESGGPLVDAPGDRGFGRQLIERTGRLPYLRSKLEFPTTGVRCRVWATLPEPGQETTGQALPDYFDPGQRRGASRQGEPTGRRIRQRGARRVLVVEDDPLDALRIEEVVSDAGYLVVDVIQSAGEAERALQELTFDVAIVDVAASAFDAARIADELVARHLPVVVIASERDRPPAQQGRAFLARPLVPADLLAELAGLLNRD
jgi:PAS domain S-box-containing protein